MVINSGSIKAVARHLDPVNPIPALKLRGVRSILRIFVAKPPRCVIHRQIRERIPSQRRKPTP